MDRQAKPRKHASGRWYAAIGERDKRGKASYVYAPKTVTTERQAWKWFEAETARRQAQRLSAVDPTVFWLCQGYLAWAESRAALGKMTRAHYRGLCSKLTLFWLTAPAPDAPPLRDRPARTVEPEDLAGCVEAWERAGYAPHYRKGIVRAVRAAFRWGVAKVPGRMPERILTADPLDGYRGETLPEAPDRFVEPATVRRFIRWAWARARALPADALGRRFDRMYLLMFRFMGLTGCRPGEACKLRWEMIDRARGLIRMKGKATDKTGKQRVIHLTRPVLRILGAIERLPRRHDIYIFTHMRGTRAAERGHVIPEAGEPWPDGSAASKKLRTWREEAVAAGVAGIERVGPKRLINYTNRHNYASTALMAGMTTAEAAELLGNTPQMIESTYGHIQPEHTARRAQEMAERRGRRGR